jgi:hypothetical protein
MSSTNHPAFWPYDYRDRVVLGWKGLVVGVLVADVMFFLAGTLPGVFSRPSYASYALMMMGVSMVFGIIPIGAVGLPVGALLGKILRGVRNQWIHVAAFIVAGAVVGTLVGATFTGWTIHTLAYMTLPAALGAGVGRLAVWKLVLINDHPSLT